MGAIRGNDKFPAYDGLTAHLLKETMNTHLLPCRFQVCLVFECAASFSDAINDAACCFLCCLVLFVAPTPTCSACCNSCWIGSLFLERLPISFDVILELAPKLMWIKLVQYMKNVWVSIDESVWWPWTIVIHEIPNRGFHYFKGNYYKRFSRNLLFFSNRNTEIY